MIHIDQLRKSNHRILAIGSHKAIIQSILDFDFISGKDTPSVVSIVAGGRKFERFFYGKKEITIPVVSSLNQLSEHIKQEVTLFINLSSGRRVLTYSQEALHFPNIMGGVVFAEDVPEEHALTLYRTAQKMGKFILVLVK